MNTTRRRARRPGSNLVGAIVALGLAACSTPALLTAQTQGELFNKYIAAEKQRCAGRIPPSAEMQAATKRSGIRLTDCDLLLLETPENPMATEAGRQAHAIRLPAPHDKPKEVYKPGMSSAEYFQALCAAEAGEFIFRTVDNVEGVFEMRPRTKSPNYAFNHLYYLEDPYGHTDAEATDGQWFMLRPNRYRFLERYEGNDNTVYRYSGYRRLTENTERRVTADTRSSRYGYTWRGIARHRDREHGIAGGELIVVDLETKEIVGFRRGFAYTSIGSRGANWEVTPVCPKYGYQGGRDKDVVAFSFWFIGKVLRPPGWDIEFKKLRGEIRWN